MSASSTFSHAERGFNDSHRSGSIHHGRRVGARYQQRRSVDPLRKSRRVQLRLMLPVLAFLASLAIVLALAWRPV
ncbi:hypothetical protein [Mesorhizobium australicum]|uniref:hypothetical protein n=1 Tax=Mesorhizobium australicum TaxID=536018 RepID=UPI003336CD78